MPTALPDLSNSMYVARLRHIQSIHERSDRRNPDTVVRRFLPLMRRVRTAWMRSDDLSRLRSDPFYYYLLARTKYYDQVLLDAISEGVKLVLIVGCGSDTRTYRFREELTSAGAAVLECDQAPAIRARKALTKNWERLDFREYLPLDLNDGAWPELDRWLAGKSGRKALLLMEGVTPYLETAAFGRFLELLASRFAAGSLLAYDFKLAGVHDNFGRDDRTRSPFRLPADSGPVAAYHEPYGLKLEHMELSSGLCQRLVPGLHAPVFSEDGVVRLRVTSRLA